MKIIQPSFSIEGEVDGGKILQHIERAGRTCYKSENLITTDSAKRFVEAIIKRGHESVLEHASISVRVICDRGVSHEIVRHRIASYSQESTRYCCYNKEKFGGQITFIKPCFWEWTTSNPTPQYARWLALMKEVEKAYLELIELGASAQEARAVLPNSLKTELVMTMNLREWRHFFRLRTAKAAHPQMREIACPMLDEFKKQIPIVFDDISYDR
jgi:thymidylate synthase (FAD)